jgi:predicted TIM-barrel fold metal-dependent hydrolase
VIIDFHTHIFSPKVKESRQKYVERDPLFSLLYSNPRAALATAEDLISSMDQQSIDKSVILNVAWESSDLCHESNEYILESVTRYPQRLIGFGMVKLDQPDSALEEIEILAKNGIKGIGEIRPLEGWLRDPSLVQPVIQSIMLHQMVLLTHTSEPVGHSYDGKGNITPQSIYPLISAFPNLKLVCAHWGGGLPFYALMPEVKKSLGQVYFDSAASPYLYEPEIYALAAQMAGPDKILFGSDYPLLRPRRLLNEIQSQDLNEGLRLKILAKNALTLLGIKEDK